MSDSLKINVMIIPDSGRHLVFSEDEDWFKKCVCASEDVQPEFRLIHADVDCLITKSGDTIFIRGKLNVRLCMDCSRCLEPANLTAGGDFTYTLLPAPPETREDVELSAEDLEIGSYKGDFIDLAPMIYEQIVLLAPMKVLCDPQCKGLCPYCGVNRNAVSCGCRTDRVDERLAVLKKIQIKN
ncbi:MAG: DUF177 domain-containing protein [Smithellaceae bacterium]